MTCIGTKKDGDPCKQRYAKYNGYCWWHKSQYVEPSTSSNTKTVIQVGTLALIILTLYMSPFVGGLWTPSMQIEGRGSLYVCPQTHDVYNTAWGIDIAMEYIKTNGITKYGSLVGSGANKGCYLFRSVGRDGETSIVELAMRELKEGHHHVKIKFGTAKKGYVYGDFYNEAVLVDNYAPVLTPKTETRYIGKNVEGEDAYNMIIYQAPIRVWEDEKWKSVQDARSLKDTEIKPIISFDGDNEIKVLDYNNTAIIIETKTSLSNVGKQIPLRQWQRYYNETDDKIKYRKLSEEKPTYSSTDDKKTRTYYYDNYNELMLEFGENSTTLIINAQGVEEIGTSESVSNDWGIQVKWDISSIPSGNTIVSAFLVYWIRQNTGDSQDTDSNITRVDDQGWTDAINSATYKAQTLTNERTDILFNTTADDTFTSLEVTEQLTVDYDLENTFTTFRIFDPDHSDFHSSLTLVSVNNLIIGGDPSTQNFRFETSANTASTGMLPYLNITFSISDTFPTVNLTSPGNDSINGSRSPVFGYLPIDDFQITNSSLFINGTFNTTNTTTIQNGTDNLISASDPFPNQISIRWIIQVCDNSSQCTNSSERTMFINVVDNPPTVNLTFPDNNSRNDSTTHPFGFIATDDGTIISIKLFINNTFNSTNTSEFTSNGTEDTISASDPFVDHTTHTWIIEACDNATVSQCTNSSERIMTMDAEAPDITIVAPSEGLTSDNTPLLNITYTSIGNYTWWELNGTIMNLTTPGVLNITELNIPSLADRHHNITAKANSSFGHTHQAEVIIIVDTTPPTIRHDSPTNFTNVSNTSLASQGIHGLFNDTVAGIDSILTNDSIWSTTDTTSPYNFSNQSAIPLGVRHILIIANDTLNNTAYEHIVFNVSLDITEVGINFQIWNGASWVPAADLVAALLPTITCDSSGCIYPKNVSDSAQNDTRGIYNGTNNGTAEGDFSMKINATISQVDIKCGNDNDPNNATILTTSFQTIEEELAAGDDAEIWCWGDFSGGIGIVLIEPQAQVI